MLLTQGPHQFVCRPLNLLAAFLELLGEPYTVHTPGQNYGRAHARWLHQCSILTDA
jgi:hypothetical protein